MPRALWLLIGLRLRGWSRRLSRNLHTFKGAVLAFVGVVVAIACLVPYAFAALLQPEGVTTESLEAVRRFGPLALLGYCLLTLLFSSGERAIYFSPAEVAFLFAGPFTRRQLLAYKVGVIIINVLLTALLSVFFRARLAASMLAAYVGMALALLFIQLFAMAVFLIADTIGARAYNRGRRLVLGLVLALAVLALLGLERGAVEAGWQEALEGLERSRVVQVALTPFGWFVRAFTSEHLWPDLVQWGSLGLGVDLVLLVIVFALDANYLETAAVTSERVYAQIQRMRTGGGASAALTASGKARFSLPALPWWGGVGPVAWRQLTAVPRTRGPLVILVSFFAMLVGPAIAFAGDEFRDVPLALIVGPLLVWMTVVLSPFVTYDFRGDLDRMDILKSLPIASWRVAVGQLVAPVVLVTGLQWLALAVSAAATGQADGLYGAAALYLLPLNFLLFAIENLMFLWFPSRAMPSAPGDVQALGRYMVIFLAKMLILGVTLSTVALVVAGLALASNWATGLAAGWVVLAAVAAALVPFVAGAFDRFDVSADTPP
jgi:hypothetical protein